MFGKIADKVAKLTGHSMTFATAFSLVLLWAISGPYFNYSENWQIIINTATTIITFLMIFLLQHSQNRDGLAIQAKLDSIIHALDRADDKLIGIEAKTEEEILLARKDCEAGEALVPAEEATVTAAR